MKRDRIKLAAVVFTILCFTAVSGNLTPELQRVAQVVKNDTVVFSIRSEPLLYGSISIAVEAFCLSAFVVMLMKLRKVMIVLSVLQIVQSKQVNAATLPSFVYKNDKTTPAPSKLFFENIDLTIEHYILILCIGIFITLILLLVYTCKCKSTKTILIVELTNGDSCIHSLSLCPTYWEIKVPHDISKITIQGMWSPTVSFDWDTFEIKNKLNENKIQLKS